MQRWEYRVVYLPHRRSEEEKIAGEKVQTVVQQQAILNEYGQDGWEVVGFHSTLSGTATGSFHSLCVLKRPLEG